MSIGKQKQVANEIYESLRVVDPHCILAGGAPRNWHFNCKASDLDFYFVSTASTIDAVRKQLEKALGREVKLLMDRDGHKPNEMYKSMPNLIRIWELEFADEKIQLIQLSGLGSTWKVVDKMDVSICKAWYTPEKGIQLHKDFKLSLASNIMFVSEGYSWDGKHGQKMINYWGDKFTAGYREKAIEAVVNKAVEEIQ